MCGCLPQLGTWPTTQARALTGNRTSNILVRRPALSPLSHTSQGSSGIFLPEGHLTSPPSWERGSQSPSFLFLVLKRPLLGNRVV